MFYISIFGPKTQQMLDYVNYVRQLESTFDIEVSYCLNKNTIMEWNIKQFPTIVVIYEGCYIAGREGVMTLEQLREFLIYVGRSVQRDILRQPSGDSEQSGSVVLHSSS